MAKGKTKRAPEVQYEVVVIDFNKKTKRIEPIEPGKMSEAEIVRMNKARGFNRCISVTK